MNLVENGLDSFRKAFDRLCSIQEEETGIEFILKDILLECQHSFEVLFKELLYRKNPALVYADLDKYYKNKVKASVKPTQKERGGEQKGAQQKPEEKQQDAIRTVTFLQAFDRLIVEYDMQIDSLAYNSMEELNKRRNFLTHSEIILDPQQTYAMLAIILLSILPTLEEIPQMKDYLAGESVVRKLKIMHSVRNEWILYHLVYLVQYMDRGDMNEQERQKYKRLLWDIGYQERERIDPDYQSEKDFILKLFTEEYYGWKRRGGETEEIGETGLTMILAATQAVLEGRITGVLRAMSAACRNPKAGKEQDPFSLIEDLYAGAGLDLKRMLGITVRQIDKILVESENYGRELLELRKKQGKQRKQEEFTFAADFLFGTDGEEREEKEEEDCRIPVKKFIETVKRLFQADRILFQFDPEYEDYITAEVLEALEDYIWRDSLDFFMENLVGTFGNWGSVDNISEVIFYGVDAVCNIAGPEEFTVLCEVEVSTEYYWDREFYPDGSMPAPVRLDVITDAKGEPTFCNMDLIKSL